jgi:hypothetical protein
MGLWKDLEVKKVTMMKAQPISERLEHTRSVMSMAASWPGVSAFAIVMMGNGWWEGKSVENERCRYTSQTGQGTPLCPPYERLEMPLEKMQCRWQT